MNSYSHGWHRGHEFRYRQLLVISFVLARKDDRHLSSAPEKDQWELRTLTEAFAQSVFNNSNGIPNLSSGHYGSPGEIRTPVDGFLPSQGVQSPSLAGSLFSTLASPLHHRATRDPGPGPSPNKPSAHKTIVDADETVLSLLSLTRPSTSRALRISWT